MQDEHHNLDTMLKTIMDMAQKTQEKNEENNYIVSGEASQSQWRVALLFL